MNPKKILVVEDEPLIALNIQIELEREGYEVIIDCFNVDQALKLIECEKPDLVIIDVNLNDGKSGIDLAKILLEKDEIPYMYLTSYSDKATMAKVSTTRPYGYLVKPFNSENLIATVYVILHNFQHRKTELVAVEEQVPKEYPYYIKLVLKQINEQIGEKINISDLANLTPWETEHFGRLFKEELGMTPYQFILKSRVEASQLLLVQTDESIINVSNQVGFSTYSNFYKAFKKTTGFTPEQFRSFEKDKKWIISK